MKVKGLIPSRFIYRLNRFMAIVELYGSRVLAHLPNSGRLLTTLKEGATAYIFERRSPHRRSSYDLFAIEHSNKTIIVDSRFSNTLAKTAITEGLLDVLRGYRIVGENALIVDSRIDLLLEGVDGARFYVEVKSVTHAINGVALFPDAPTIRGRKHLNQLRRLSLNGFNTGILFSVQRSDAHMLKPNYEVDPKFCSMLREAYESGVKIVALKSTFIPPDVIELDSDTLRFSF